MCFMVDTGDRLRYKVWVRSIRYLGTSGGHPMRKLVLLCGAVLLSSVAALAQSDVSTIAAPSPAAALPASPQVSRGDLPDWQISIGYQFNRFNMPAEKTGATHSVP